MRVPLVARGMLVRMTPPQNPTWSVPVLSLLTRLSRDCEGLSRRSFLQIGSLAGVGVTLPMLLSAKKNAMAAGGAVKDVNCILIWTQGGTSHHDTFDPKPNAPVSVKGEFGV